MSAANNAEDSSAKGIKMKKGPEAQKEEVALQSELEAKCSALFTEEREENALAEENLFIFLSSCPVFNSLNFFNPIAAGFHQQALPIELIALTASVGKTRCFNYIFERLDITKLNLNKECVGAIFISGTTFLHLICLTILNNTFAHIEEEVSFKCLTRIFQKKDLLKRLNFNAEIRQSYYRGTTTFWMIAMIALRHSRREFLDGLLRNPDTRKKLNFNVACQRATMEHALYGMLSEFVSLSQSVSAGSRLVLPSVELLTEEREEPYTGISIGHIFANLALAGSPDYLLGYIAKETPNAITLNKKILGGPYRGASLFYLIIIAELVNTNQLIAQIPKKVLQEIEIDDKIEGRANFGATALYWLSALVCKGKTAPFDCFMSFPGAFQHNFRVTYDPENRNTSILWWLSYAAAKQRSLQLEKVLRHKPLIFVSSDFQLKSKIEKNKTTPFYWLIHAAIQTHTRPLDYFFENYALTEIDFNDEIEHEECSGTTHLWWLAYCAFLGMPKYVERVMAHISLEKLNFKAECISDCAYQGWTVLQLLAEAMLRGHSEAFIKVLQHEPPLPLDIHYAQPMGKNKGLTAFHQIGQMAYKNKFACLDHVLMTPRFSQTLLLNQRSFKGPSKGTTPFWWLCAAAARHKHSGVEQVLARFPPSEIDLNARSEKKENEGLTCFGLLIRGSLRHSLRPLQIVFSRFDITKIEYNVATLQDAFPGTTPFWWLALLAVCGNPEFLEQVLEVVPGAQLNGNALCIRAEFEGTTPLWWMVQAALLNRGACLQKWLAKICVKELNCLAKPESGYYKDQTVLLGLAALGYRELVSTYVASHIEMIDINTTLSVEGYQGTSLFWWFIQFATQNSPACLEIVFNQVPVESIDFEVKNEVSGKTIWDMLQNTKWEPIAQFLSQLKKTKGLKVKTDNPSHFVKLEQLASIAEENGYAQAFVLLARLYLDLKYKDRLQRILPKISQDHLEYKTLHQGLLALPVEETEKEKNAHPPEESEATRCNTSLINDLVQALSTCSLCEETVSPAFIACQPAASSVLVFSATAPPSQISARRQAPALLINPDTPVSPHFRSFEATRIHAMVMRCCHAPLDKLMTLLSKLELVLAHSKVGALIELSINGFSHLDDAIRLPFLCQQNRQAAEVIAVRLFLILSEAMQKKLNSQQLATLLCNKPEKGPILLHSALWKQSQGCLEHVLAFSEKFISKSHWQEMLKRADDFGHTAYQYAVSSNNPRFLQLFTTAVERAFNEESAAVLQRLAQKSRYSFRRCGNGV